MAIWSGWIANRKTPLVQLPLSAILLPRFGSDAFSLGHSFLNLSFPLPAPHLLMNTRPPQLSHNQHQLVLEIPRQR
jgi:hypothetical protein